jgi:hypothetical protein
MPNYSVLIQTCDAYKACWESFFKCFDKYWADSDCDVYFVNEERDVSRSYGRQIKTGKGAWSDRLLRALSVMPDQPIFYMLEDFWITKEIDIRKYFDLFLSLEADSLRVNYKCRLTILNHVEDNLYKIDNRGRYVLSLQPSFWKKEFLQSVLKKDKSPWQFELEGTDKNPNAYFAVEDWYVGAYREGEITKEGEAILSEYS